MDKESFIKETPYLYHLTDRRNLDSIKHDKKIYSTVSLIDSSEIEHPLIYLRTRREKESRKIPILISGVPVYIRDQHPINSALGRSLTDGWTKEQFIYYLNKRVFMWPTYKRMYNHYKTYKNDNPIILRFSSQEMFNLNPGNVKLSKINSGATRCIGGKYKGNPVPRGPNTFQTFLQLSECKVEQIAEVTFEAECNLPNSFKVSYTPDGPWREV